MCTPASLACGVHRKREEGDTTTVTVDCSSVGIIGSLDKLDLSGLGLASHDDVVVHLGGLNNFTELGPNFLVGIDRVSVNSLSVESSAGSIEINVTEHAFAHLATESLSISLSRIKWIGPRIVSNLSFTKTISVHNAEFLDKRAFDDCACPQLRQLSVTGLNCADGTKTETAYDAPATFQACICKGGVSCTGRDVVICKEGQYNVANNAYTLPCQSCEAGTFSDGLGKDKCEKCSNGTFSEKSGSSKCDKCEDD